MKRPRISRRRGVTLLELATLMTVSVVITGLALTLLAKVMGLNNANRDHLQRSMVLFRLADQFRGDVHAATTASIAGDSTELDLTLSNGRRVQYAIDGGSAERTAFDGPAVIARDWFELPGQHISRFELAGDNREVIAVVQRLNPEEAETSEVLSTLRIRAVVGRDHRFTQASAKQNL